MRRALTASALAIAAIVLAACGGGTAPSRAQDGTGATPTAAARPTSAPITHTRMRADGSAELVWIRRVAAVPDPIADDLRIQVSGRATFRKGYAGLGRGTAVEELSKAELRHFRRLVARAHPAALPEPSADPTRGGYAYVVRADGGTGAANTGHFPRAVAPLLDAADRLISRLADHLDFRSLNR